MFQLWGPSLWPCHHPRVHSWVWCPHLWGYNPAPGFPLMSGSLGLCLLGKPRHPLALPQVLAAWSMRSHCSHSSRQHRCLWCHTSWAFSATTFTGLLLKNNSLLLIPPNNVAANFLLFNGTDCCPVTKATIVLSQRPLAKQLGFLNCNLKHRIGWAITDFITAVWAQPHPLGQMFHMAGEMGKHEGCGWWIGVR